MAKTQRVCAWDTLAMFSHNDPKLRATPGAVGVLHTHSRPPDFHPHVQGDAGTGAGHRAQVLAHQVPAQWQAQQEAR